MLWGDLDIAVLQKGADELHKRLGRLKDLKGSSVYLSVSDVVSNILSHAFFMLKLRRTI
jgi:hypothetical protein